MMPGVKEASVSYEIPNGNNGGGQGLYPEGGDSSRAVLAIGFTIRLFLKEYLPLLLVAGLAASPLAWWLLQRWLDNYATRITITIAPFAAVLAALAVLMSFLIAAQTSRAALANPVNSLKTE